MRQKKKNIDTKMRKLWYKTKILVYPLYADNFRGKIEGN